jgi:hypothetical protein
MKSYKSYFSNLLSTNDVLKIAKYKLLLLLIVVIVDGG